MCVGGGRAERGRAFSNVLPSRIPHGEGSRWRRRTRKGKGGQCTTTAKHVATHMTDSINRQFRRMFIRLYVMPRALNQPSAISSKRNMSSYHGVNGRVEQGWADTYHSVNGRLGVG